MDISDNLPHGISAASTHDDMRTIVSNAPTPVLQCACGALFTGDGVVDVCALCGRKIIVQPQNTIRGSVLL